MMKAYEVSAKGEDYKVIVYCDKPSEAKALAKCTDALGDVDWLALRPTRAPYADNTEHLSEEDRWTMLIENGWWFESGNVRVDSDDLEGIKKVGLSAYLVMKGGLEV
ncbi:hypothetical protein HCJ66_01135 [Listeria sp. FSL L7-1582]|uniref:hypothetical protein n=1 Tax=Listeria portnoyi TaxID=2713504 RepID=UPI00164E02C6|nr:hypothetical protein [Listeria portnoyi]MBC6308146.1 hypothetical protein [Listeria portnoyi]